MLIVLSLLCSVDVVWLFHYVPLMLLGSFNNIELFSVKLIVESKNGERYILHTVEINYISVDKTKKKLH